MIEVPKDGTYVITATGGAGGNGHSYYTGANAGTVPVSEANLFTSIICLTIEYASAHTRASQPPSLGV